eukprot:TRINITY_DN38397_c0_g1_i2.p1 TRINITY_DN38397_c0_g1~~TRINITY_DN38397_c0_g1_i2.p1  ORF type:complete len:2316 (+),score=492.02 TRINITY_DN38397_c0_g1_i2:357-6950(+)
MGSFGQVGEASAEEILGREEIGNCLVDDGGGGRGGGGFEPPASSHCLEKDCGVLINGSGDCIGGADEFLRDSDVLENGVEDGCGVSCSDNGNGCEHDVDENGAVAGMKGRFPVLDIACLPSITGKRDWVDGGEGNCVVGICENELSVFGRKELESGCGVDEFYFKKDGCLLKLDGCEKTAVEPQGNKLVPGPCLETCSSQINTSGISINGPNGNYLVVTLENGEELSTIGRSGTEERWESNLDSQPCSLHKLDGFENVLCHNEVVLGSTDQCPTSELSSKTTCLPSIDDNRCAFDETSVIHSGVASEYQAELSIIAGNEPHCNENNIMNKLHSSPQLDACENLVCINEVVLGSQGHFPASQSCLEMSCPSKSSSNGVGDNMGGLCKFQPAVYSKNGMKLSATGWNETEDDCGVRRFCSDGRSTEDWLCSSPQGDEFSNEVGKTNSQCQLHLSQSCLETSWMKESPSILTEGPPDAASYCAVEEAASPQPLQLPNGLNVSSSKHLVPDTYKRDASYTFDSSKLAVNDGMIEVKPDCVSRNTRARKSNRLARTRKAARQAIDTTGVFLSIARGKRSCCNQARSSAWGAMGNIIQLFEKNSEIMKFNSQLDQVLNQEPKRGRGGLGSKRSRKAQIKASKSKCCASTSHVHSKVKNERKRGKKGLQAVPPNVVETLDSVQSVVSNCLPPSDSQASFEVLEPSIEILHRVGGDGSGAVQLPCLVQNLEKFDMPPDVCVRDALVGDKELESTVTTQDTSIENNKVDFPGISSIIGTDASGEAPNKNRRVDPETSPDSDMLHVRPDVVNNATEGIISSQRKAYTYARRKVRNDSFPESTLPKSIDGSVSSPSQHVTAPCDITPSKMKCASIKKRKKTCKRDMHHATEFSSIEEKLAGPTKLKKAKKGEKRRMPKKAGNGCDPGNTFNSATGNDSSKSSNIEALTINRSASELDDSRQVLKVETGFEPRVLSGQEVGTSQSESWMLDGLLSAGNTNGRKLSRSSNSRLSKRRSQAPGSAGPRRGTDSAWKGARKNKAKDTVLSGQGVYKDESHALATGVELGGTNTADKVPCKDMPSSIVLPMGNDKELNKSCHSLEPQFFRPRLAWVRCDDCHKWRCIPAELADEIEETDCRWTCKDNKDKAFADCLIPQEKTNAEINAELEISDASCEEDSCSARPISKGLEPRQLTASQQASWTLIKNNLFLHRSRRTQSIDEVMVCHCKPPLDSKLGCGEQCLNRMLNIECVRGTCPCADICSNQQFQRRKYAKFKWFRCGKKGYGLQLQEDVSQGSFLIEYVGEVLDLHAYEARQREYALRGQKHFYFMTLNGSEVIDACVKGNLGRFINHSCDPNCRTEKWMVNGEVCIGLFAIRDIKKGEEVTFDYNYVRVFGAAAKKCVCGSSGCRGYIGGDPSTTESIVQGDSDDEYPEPVMMDEDGEVERKMEDTIPSTSLLDVPFVQHVGVSLETTDTIKNPNSIQELERPSQVQQSVNEIFHGVQQLDVSLQTEESVCNSVPAVSPVGVSLQVEDCTQKSSPATQQFDVPIEAEDTQRKSSSSVQQSETLAQNASAVSKSMSDFVRDNSKSISDTVEDKSIVPKSRPIVKLSRSSGSIKKGKFNAFHGMTNRPKKLVEGAGSRRFEGVEEKLNELLDADGGISKRKDATKGYLKLLLVTAASGDHVNGEAFHSTRDLSMVLDAILKTKSRMVLLDIINKNGLQMLHNIMKQNRRNFNKIPIIRKLLKVLEFLAVKEILSIEHINTSPPCAGMESFRESMITLTRHNDTQVQQIARSFRDRWIPRTIRRITFTERDDDKIESQSGYYNRFPGSHRRRHDQSMRHSDAIDCVTEATSASIPPDADRSEGTCVLPLPSGSVGPAADSIPANGTKRTRKRKSRWDQPVEMNMDQQPLVPVEGQVSNLEVQSSPCHPRMYNVFPNQTTEIQRETNCSDDAEMEHVNDDAPPGFSSPRKSPLVAPGSGAVASNCSPQVPSSNSACDVVSGHAQKRFNPHLPVSYGIPLAFAQQLGTLNEEASSGWAIAPGLPFHPFPPLPKYPRGETRPPFQPSSASIHKRMKHGAGDEAQQASIHHLGPRAHSAAAVVGPPQEAAATGESHPQTIEKGRWQSDGLGRRHFRQQKWNNRGSGKNLPPPWVRLRNGWGLKGHSNLRNGPTNLGGGAGNETREAGGLCHSESVNCTNDREKINSTIDLPQQ